MITQCVSVDPLVDVVILAVHHVAQPVVGWQALSEEPAPKPPGQPLARV